MSLEEIRRAKRRAWVYARIYGVGLYDKLYRYLDSLEKRLGGGGGG